MILTNIALYVPGAFYAGTDSEWETTKSSLESSGFNSLINWAFHVGPDGSISNQGNVTKNGAYAGNPVWQTRLESLKNKKIGRLYFSLWGNSGTFPNIKALIADGQQKKGGKLYNNFLALKENLPVDGIDLDDEEGTIDVKMVTEFSEMLYDIGLGVSFCPYMDHSAWIQSYEAISATAPLEVTAFNLQCYSGGEGNDPNTWIGYFPDPAKAVVLVNPGFQRYKSLGGGAFEGATPAQIQQQLSAWNATAIQTYGRPLPGAFLWKDDGFAGSGYALSDYSAAMIAALS